MALHAEQVVRGLDALRSLVAHALADPFAGAATPTSPRRRRTTRPTVSG